MVGPGSWGGARALFLLALVGALGCGPPPQQAPAALVEEELMSCGQYCRLAHIGCAAWQPLYGSPAACRRACAQMSVQGSLGEVQGDTLACRITYLLLAPSAPARYCPQAASDGGTACRGTAPQRP